MDEIDLDEQTWTIPGARMKAAASTASRSPRAPSKFSKARTLAAASPCIFPGTKPNKPLSNMTFLKAARRLTTATLTTHGFRSSFRDWSAEKDERAARRLRSGARAHVKDKTEAAYQRTDLFDRRRDLMDLWAQFATSTPGGRGRDSCVAAYLSVVRLRFRSRRRGT